MTTNKDERYEMIKTAHQKILKSQKFRALMKLKAKQQRGYEERGRKPKVKYVDEDGFTDQTSFKDSGLPELRAIRETYEDTTRFDNIWN